MSANLSAVVGGGERDYAKQLWTEVESTYRGAVRGNTLQRRLSGNGGGGESGHGIYLLLYRLMQPDNVKRLGKRVF